MRAIGAILGAIAGAVLGYIGAFVVGYPIIVAMDGPDRDGGIAMGVAFTLGPAMAVITALIFLAVILRLTRPKKSPQTAAEAAPAADPDEALLRPPPGTNPGPDTQTLIAVAVVVLLIVAGTMWLHSD